VREAGGSEGAGYRQVVQAGRCAGVVQCRRARVRSGAGTQVAVQRNPWW